MAQYTQRTQPMHRPGQSDHGHGGALSYGGKPASGGVVAPPQPRAPPAAPYAPQPYPPAQLRLHQPGYGSAALSYRDTSYVRGGGAVGEYRPSGTRMSLLATAYLPPPAPSAHHPPPADPPPFKKIRLTAERVPVTSLPHHQTLRVDTREPVSSYNTVEVLSPNPPSDTTIEDQSFRTTKDELLQQISKVDREMALSESTLTKLKKKQEELEESASKPARAEEPEEAPPRHRSLAQCVYADNRKKASSAHALLSHLGPPVLYPIYNQPQDTEVYHENIRKHRTLRKRLAEHIRRLKYEAEKREDSLAEAYSRRAAEWIRRVERIEQGQKRKAKDARNREFFEKVFPELRKQREERERFNRLGARVKSEAELEEIADGLHEQEHEDKKMRSLTVVPPLLRDPRDTRPVYIDTNRRCMDMESEHKELRMRNVWSQTEREVFKEKYLQHPKNFGQIASFLPRKNVRDCVRFYYLSKKAENYKQLLRKPRQRRSARNPPRPAPEPELPAGVTTRLQRSQGTTARAADKDPSMEDNGMGPAQGPQAMGSDPVSCIPVPPIAPAHPASTELIRTPPLPLSPPPASSAPLAPVTSTTVTAVPAGSPNLLPLPSTPTPPTSIVESVTSSASEPTVTISIVNTPSTCVTPTSQATATSVSSPQQPTLAVVTSSPPTPQPAQPPTPTQPPPTPETALTERTRTPSTITTTTTTTVTTTSSPLTCAVCNMPGATRTVSRSRAIHYGLKEDAVGARVCEPCHCRCVRSRYTRCAVPTCPGPRVRAKRLRHLPPRWHDLSLELKKPLMEEFEIPSELSKCCLACFKRITRRLETIGEGGGNPEPTEEEAARFRALLREHGTAWDKIAAVSGRTPASLKAFYFTYRKRLQLERVETDRTSSSAESGSATCCDSDTASASSPPRAPPAAPAAPAPPAPRTDAAAPKHHRRHRRDEYDSSATETADEENDAPAAKVLPPTSMPTPASSSTAPSPSSTSVATVATVSSSTVARNGPASTPLTVRDVVLNVIEISLTRDTQPVPPAIKPHHLKVSGPSLPRVSSAELATLSVVSSSHNSSSGGGLATGSRSPPRPATITPLAQADAPKDGVVVLHIEPRAEPLLDLSVKRPRLAGDQHQPAHYHQHHQHQHPHQHHMQMPHQHQHQLQQQQTYRNSTDYQYRSQQERDSPTYNSKPKPVSQAPRPALKPIPNPKGSITLGTPVESRFEARRTPEPKTGSITAGTPVHGSHHLTEKRNFDYAFKRRSPGGAYYAATSQPRPQSPSFSPTGASPYSRSPYGHEQRQIIMADFITSQQMHGGARRDREREREQRPASPQYSPQRREPREPVSVIQRHTYHHQQPQQHQQHQQHHQHQALQTHSSHPPPGHEAFVSLVDVASAATALPVPRGSADAKPENKPQPQPQPQPHHSHPHDIRLREMASAQKYHQQQIQQYQVMDPRAPQQIKYVDRAGLIQMQRERAMAAIQDRHQIDTLPQHQQHPHQQQILQDRHHMPHQQGGSSQEGDRRLLAASTYTATKHRQKDNRPPSGPPGAPGPPVPPGAAGDTRPRPAEGTLTAASLIDAIITHQISQATDQRFPQQNVRECDNSNPPPNQDRPERGPTPAEREREREREREEQFTSLAHKTSIKLGDLASNIITRDFCSPTTSLIHHHNSRFSSEGGYSNNAPAEDWKRREPPKHVPYLEPVSPPDNHSANRTNTNRRYGCVPGAGVGSSSGGVLTAFDYVTNRIVEVMRSDAEERPKPIAFPTAYTYPYSALNVATPTGEGGAGAAPPGPAGPAPPPPPEPAPLMSAQYEPLSDED